MEENSPNLKDALAWLAYCLKETEAAMAAVKAAARPALGHQAGGQYLEFCETAAQIVTLRGLVARWVKSESGIFFPRSGKRQESNHE